MASTERPRRSLTHVSYTMVGGDRPTAQHILDERRRNALTEIDDAPFSWGHVKVCLVAGVGFFTDSYDIFAINIASTILGYVYGPNHSLMLSDDQDLSLKIATPIGIVIGQLVFGWLADIVGRKRMYGVELTIIIVTTFAQAVSASGYAIDIIRILTVWRFILGIGIGGDYPLSAIITSEFSATKFRGRMMTAVVSAQAFGNFTAALVGLILVISFKKTFPVVDNTGICQGDLNGIDSIWRILIGLGCIPGAIGLFFRLTITETPRFTMDIKRNIDQATHDITNVTGGQNEQVDEDDFIQRIDIPRADWADFRAYFSKRKNLKILVGTSWSWFALDIAFYGLGLNTNVIFDEILPIILPGSNTFSGSINGAYDRLIHLCEGNLILSVVLLAGLCTSFVFIDTWGRKRIQLMGFAVLSALLITLGFTYGTLLKSGASHSQRRAYFVLYCFANFFQNFGANVSTFVIPGEVFPTRYRSTAYGISAASGKVGAIVAQIVFSRFRTRGGLNSTATSLGIATGTLNATICGVLNATVSSAQNATISGAVGNSGISKNIDTPLKIFAFITLTGIISTLLLPETKGRTLEELSNEKQEGFVRGVRNWRGHIANFAPIQMTNFEDHDLS